MSFKRKVYFYTLGCRVNQYETDAARELFISAGYESCDDPSEADVCVVNTCTVTAEADRKSGQRLRRLSRENPNAVIVAMGCSSEMADGFVDADIVLGTRDKNEIVLRVEDFIEQKDQKSRRTAHKRPDVSKTDIYHDFGTVISPEGSRAFMKIQDGCNNFCTFCIIPFARGRVASRSPQHIIEEARNLAAAGFKEIIVSGIEICSYGADRGEGIEALLNVLRDIASVDGISRIRLGSMEPSSLTAEFINGLSQIEQLCPHFHLSLQSGSDTVLKRMNRKYDSSLYLEKVNLLRDAFPGMKLTTDVICGFPGETDEEFSKTLNFLQECGMNKVHVFPYSVRSGTRAASMVQVPGNIARERASLVSRLSDEAEERFARSLVGCEHEVLVETVNTDKTGRSYFTGYTREYVMTRCYFDFLDSSSSSSSLPSVGSIVKVRSIGNEGPVLIC